MAEPQRSPKTKSNHAWRSAPISPPKRAVAGLRLLFEAVDFTTGVIARRLFGRREAVAGYIAAMRETKMPRRIYSTDDAGNYLSRVLDGYSYRSETVSEDAKAVARELDRIMTSVRNQHGMMAEVRTLAAINEAVEKHSPEELSPPFVTGGIHHWINRATSGQLKGLPGSSDTLVSALLDRRDFKDVLELWDCVRCNTTSRSQASCFLVAASLAFDGKTVPDEIRQAAPTN